MGEGLEEKMFLFLFSDQTRKTDIYILYPMENLIKYSFMEDQKILQSWV